MLCNNQNNCGRREEIVLQGEDGRVEELATTLEVEHDKFMAKCSFLPVLESGWKQLAADCP